LEAVFCVPAVSNSSVLDKHAWNNEIVNLAEEWAQIKFLSQNDEERASKMEALGRRADELVMRNPSRAEALVWDGIITAERASMTWGLAALNLATRARDILLQAESLDPKAFDAGAPTTLGVLYYRVPVFPIAWGDKDRARSYLEEAVRNAPNGREARYFFAHILYEQGEYGRAKQLLETAMKMAHHPERPVWDHYLPLMIEDLLRRVQEKAPAQPN
jgi:tetratricopeptide (TPR) repeat protein